jgi:hypothetical protein
MPLISMAESLAEFVLANSEAHCNERLWTTPRTADRILARALAVLAVEEVAHGLSAGFVSLRLGFAVVGGCGLLLCGSGRIGFTARGAAVGEAWFVRLQLELF